MNDLILQGNRALAMPLTAASLDGYIHAVNQLPMLTQEEEQDLARAWLEEENTLAAQKLVLSHLRFVVHIARSYSGYGLQLADLIQEGNVGLMKAVKRFDPDKEVRLVSFAVHWIKAEIHEYVIKNWRLVKVATTKAQRKLFFNLRKAKKGLNWLTADETQAVADDLGVKVAEVQEMEKRLYSHDVAVDLSPDESDDEAWKAPAAYLEAPDADPSTLVEEEEWAQQSQNRLLAALQTLDQRSRDIIQARWMVESKATLHDLAAEYGVSAERIRQIEAQAMKKLRLAIS
jgi:RNA polymerase sigma-32 factor